MNAIGHHFGRRPYDNRAGNLQWLAFVTAGEGLHNNHHAAPTSAKLVAPLVRDRPRLVRDQGADVVRLARVRVMTELPGFTPAARRREAASV